MCAGSATFSTWVDDSYHWREDAALIVYRCDNTFYGCKGRERRALYKANAHLQEI